MVEHLTPLICLHSCQAVMVYHPLLTILLLMAKLSSKHCSPKKQQHGVRLTPGQNAFCLLLLIMTSMLFRGNTPMVLTISSSWSTDSCAAYLLINELHYPG